MGETALAGPLLDRLRANRAERAEAVENVADDTPATLPAGVQQLTDLAYGPAAKQRLDVYLPTTAGTGRPIVLMVHGGAWKVGDKRHGAVVTHKVARWVPQGCIFVSVNYPLLPEANPLQQAQEVAQALAYVQRRAGEWHGDATKVVLMGHSAGAHLVALLAASPALATAQNARPWLGSVLLDSAALDVVRIMEAHHYRFYDAAFGPNPAFWKTVSPYHVFTPPVAPLLLVCSTRREESIAQAHRFAQLATARGTRVTVLEQDRSHRGINQDLGLPGDYTTAVEAFLSSLDPALAAALLRRP